MDVSTETQTVSVLWLRLLTGQDSRNGWDQICGKAANFLLVVLSSNTRVLRGGCVRVIATNGRGIF